ncbi:hypothetical protein CPB85DRAFT_1269723 [Mucidula mucida]|nr:hypothetical protein CPB85DRAFT_1269723 [Mucidula mucida]
MSATGGRADVVLAGISTGVALKGRLGFQNFTIYEKAGDVGGTWRDNTYPGCGCDVPAHWYSLSTDPNPSWNRHYASQRELHAYWRSVFDKHALRDHTVFNTIVVRSEWDEDLQRWTVWLQRDGRETIEHAEILLYAIGGFMEPMWPKDIKGMEAVGVIGNGCSAAQLVPAISHEPSTEVINFCRTPQWFVPMNDLIYPPWIKWSFANVPGVLKLWRAWLMFRSDMSFLIFNKDRKWLVDFTRLRLSAYMKDQYAAYPIPDFAPGCKRIIVDPGYLSSLNRKNVTLRWDAIDSVVEDGLLLRSGEVVPLDVIIFGTGYSVEPVDLRVQGRGMSLHDYFASQGGATAYLGSCVPGFPNLFMLLGPNVATGHASAVFSEESQIQFAMEMIKPVIAGEITSFDVKEKICVEYNDWIQERLRHSVWSECRSYYHLDRDDKSRIVATFPGPVALFWWFCRRPKWRQWDIRGASTGWRKNERLWPAYEFLLSAVLVAMFAVPWSILF